MTERAPNVREQPGFCRRALARLLLAVVAFLVCAGVGSVAQASLSPPPACQLEASDDSDGDLIPEPAQYRHGDDLPAVVELDAFESEHDDDDVDLQARALPQARSAPVWRRASSRHGATLVDWRTKQQAPCALPRGPPSV